MEGRVEVCLDGIWSAIIVYPSELIEVSMVTCKQLGFPSECELLTLCSKNTLMKICYHPTQGQCLYLIHTSGEEMLPYFLYFLIAVEVRLASQIAHSFQYQIYRIILIIIVIMTICILFIIIMIIILVL